jgi:hypothetical protein
MAIRHHQYDATEDAEQSHFLVALGCNVTKHLNLPHAIYFYSTVTANTNLVIFLLE